MTNTDVEARLRNELSRSLDTVPDAAVLDEIRARSLDSTPPSGRTDQARRGGYVMAIAAGAAVLLGTVLALSSANPSNAPIRAGSETASGDVYISPPSYLWLAVIACLGAVAAAFAGRLHAGRLAAIAAGVLTVGALITVGSMLPSLRTGAGLSGRAPELAGFELIDSQLQRWPAIGDYSLVALTYRASEPGTITLSDGSQESTEAEIDRIAAELRFDTGLPNLGKPCRQYHGEVDRPPGQEATQRQQRQDGDYFCIDDISSEELRITGAVYDVGLLWFRPFLGIPILGLAAILAILAAIEQIRPSKPRPTGSQVAYALALLLYGVALFITGSFAIDATEVSRVNGLHDCREMNAPFNDFATCREYIGDLVSREGLLDEAELLYGPLIVIADILCLILVAVGLVLALAVAKAGQLTSARRRLLMVATVLLLLLALTQLVYWDTITVTTDAFE